MKTKQFIVRKAKAEEFPVIGQMMVKIYSQLEGFPKKAEQPEYYKMLANIGEITKKAFTELWVAISSDQELVGAVVYFSDMSSYGSGGTATAEKDASGFRLLAVDPSARGLGVGTLLTKVCIEKARQDQNEQLIIHSTRFMQTAWKMYEKLGFRRSEDLDFLQGDLQVFGFRLDLHKKK